MKSGQPLAQEHRALETGERVSYAPEESLAASNAVDTQPDGYAECMCSVQKCGDDTVATFDVGTLA